MVEVAKYRAVEIVKEHVCSSCKSEMVAKKGDECINCYEESLLGSTRRNYGSNVMGSVAQY